MRIELFKRLVGSAKNPMWFFRFVSIRNGKIVAQSEGYKNLGDARRTIDRIKDLASCAKVEVIS